MTTYYVDGINGSNSNDGLSSGSAFLTIDYALTIASLSSQILVRGNTSYTVDNPTIPEGVVITGVSTDWSNDGTRVLISNATSSTAFFTVSGNRCGAANFQTDVVASGTSYWVDQSDAVYITYWSNIDFDGQSILSSIFRSNVNGATVRFFGCNFQGSADVISGAASNRAGPNYYNCFFDNIPPMHRSTRTAHFINCIFYGSGSSISGTYYHNGPIVSNCVFYEAYLIVADRPTGALRATVVNCVFMNNSGFAIRSPQTSQEPMIILQNTLFFNNTSGSLDGNFSFEGTNILDADPKFVDPENKDFRLQPDSPLIGLGFSFLNQNAGPSQQVPSSGSGGTRMSFS